MKIAYKIQINGQATDLRFVRDDYVAEAEEKVMQGDVLPDIDTLHTQAYKDYMKSIKYRELRAGAYAPLPEQFDMMYWDAVNGTNTWQEHIANVKKKHPIIGRKK
ncbi:MAG: hypothetical protein Q8N12_05665 [Thermodesulfovibrionales bacterium]|nr:hypothetical protein [Thermodesulfovibrionales bacterium]